MKKLLLTMAAVLMATCAWATDYVKVTSTSDLTSGKYLIVYEAGNVALDGSLTTIDVASNTQAVTINNGKITVADASDNFYFNIDMSAGTIISASDVQIGHSGSKNTLNTGDLTNTISINSDGTAEINGGESYVLRYNKSSGQYRFRYYAGTQEKIALYKAGTVSPTTIDAPTISGETPFLESTEVTISWTGDLTPTPDLYYTTDGTDPTATSTKYTAPFTITEGCTVKAIAVSGDNKSNVASMTFVKQAPVTGNTYTLVTDASTLKEGDVIVLGCTDFGVVNTAMGTNKFFPGGEATISGGVLTATDAAEITLSGDADAWTLTTEGGTLATNTAKVLNHVGTGTTTWTIDITDGLATIASTNPSYGRILCNYNSGNPRFLNYTSATSANMKLPEIYKKSAAPTVAAPTISGETPFLESTEVTISWTGSLTATPDIYYTTDGTEPTANSTKYTAPFTITEGCTVKAIAVSGDDKSTVASKTFVKTFSVSTLAEVNALDDNTEFVFTGTIEAIAQTGAYLYTQDGTAGMLLYDFNLPTYTQGNVIAAGWSGTKTTYNGAPEVKDITGMQASEETIELTPLALTPSQVSLDNFSRYAVIKNALVVDGKIVVNEDSVTLYDRFKVEIPELGDATSYDIYGVTGFFKGDTQFMPTMIVSNYPEINVIFTPEAGVYNAPVNVKLNVENAVGETIIIYNIIPANADSQIKLNEEDIIYDENEGIDITESCTLVISVLDSRPNAEVVEFEAQYTIDTATGIEGINAKNISSVRYYNVTGVESATPFDGMNIVVTTYNDGSKATAKVVK